MTGFATIEDVRDVVGLPDAETLPDPKIQFQLDSAKLKVNELIGDYSAYTGDDKTRVTEAECCFTAYYGLVSWNTFYTSSIENFQTEVGESTAHFYSPEQLKNMKEEWKQRALDRLNIFINEDGTIKPIGWFAV